MIAKLLLQNTFFIVAMGALLFASAGTLHWPGAWALLATSAVLGPACGLWLAKTDPALLAERLRLTAREEQPAADKKFMLVFAATALIWLVAIGLDRRMQASHVPLALQVLGLAMYLASTGFIMWVFRENSFAAPMIKVQTARDHHDGPLRLGSPSHV
jgi:protein-S-isoprenylcysteine O-methyltransferase Ste14